MLGLGSEGLGYDITEIRSVAAWQGAGFANQKYEVSVRYAGDDAFTFLAIVDYQPFDSLALNIGGSTKVTVTDDTGVLARGVEAIRFSMLDVNSPDTAGTVYREIDVFGVASRPVLPGDFNGDGAIDAADYTVWRDMLGATNIEPFQLADCNGDGVVDLEDYTVWKSQFGGVASAALEAVPVIPEPSSEALGAMAAAVSIVMLAICPTALR